MYRFEVKNEVKPISRKEFSDQSLKFLLSYSFFSLFATQGLFGNQSIKLRTEEIRHLSLLLSRKKITQIEWQDSVERIFEEIDTPGYIRYIDLDTILKKHTSNKTKLKRIHLKRAVNFGSKKLVTQLFLLSKERSIIPHGHNYMTSGFLVLRGSFHGRHYERLEDRTKHFVIRPSIDKNFLPGEFSTISDHKNNVHWFKANTHEAVLLNIHLRNLKNGPKKPGRVYLNPFGKKYEGNKIMAQKLSRKKAYSMFF